MSKERNNSEIQGPKTQVTRREVLLGAASVGAGLSLVPLLSACGGGTSASPTPSSSGAATPKKGGALAVGHQPDSF